jgi:SulP family sulfate permease
VAGTDDYFDVSNHPDAEVSPGLLIYRFDAPLLFFNADHFKARVRSLVRAAEPRPRGIILDAETMPTMDSTGAAGLGEVGSELAEKGIVFAVAAAKGPVRAMLDRTGLTRQIGPERIFPTVGAAVKAMTRVKG